MKTSVAFFLAAYLTLAPATPSLAGEELEMSAPPPHHIVYHIPLRIHLGDSGRPAQQWLPILAEINSIWFSQAGVCFVMHTVTGDEELQDGFDLWFEATLPEWNGYFTDPNDMHVRDDPDLRPADHPAASAAARTAAHELGHALGLGHRQDSDDNLMRSKTYGWQLHLEEIVQARKAARQFSPAGGNNGPCPAPAMQNTP